MKNKRRYWEKKYSKYFDSNLNKPSERLKAIWFKFKYRKCFNMTEAHLQKFKGMDKNMEKLFIKYAKVYINDEEIPISTAEERAYQILNDCMKKVKERLIKRWKFSKWAIPILVAIILFIISTYIYLIGGD